MTIRITHTKVSGKPAGSDPTRVYGTHWDADHTVEFTATDDAKLLGSSATGAGDTYSEITLGTNLSMSGNTLNVTGGGTVQISGTPTTGQYAAWTDDTTIQGVTGGNLTRTNDTNVTLTLGGTPTAALLQATSITVGWSGTLAAARGGFGADVSGSSGVPLFAAGTPTFTSTTGTGDFARATAPTLTNPVVGTQTAGENSTKAASTAYVDRAITPFVPQGRLSLTSGTAITTSDVTGATTMYYALATGRYVPIWNGTKFVMTDIGGELSNINANTAVGKAGPAAVANNARYYYVVWSDAGTIRLTRSPAWASGTSAGTGAGTAEIELVQGVLVNKVDITNGPLAGYGTVVGGARSNGSAQLTDSYLKRWVSNIYNAVPRPMRAVEPANSWTYTTASWRQANANADNQVDWFHAVDGGMVDLALRASASNTTAGGYMLSSIQIDGTSGPPTTGVLCALMYAQVIGLPIPTGGDFRGYVGIGEH
jgi:hypothetical protein